MEQVKVFILDFIFSSFESLILFLSSLFSFNLSQFKQTCYRIPALDYIGIFIWLLLLTLILIWNKKRFLKIFNKLQNFFLKIPLLIKNKKYKNFQTKFTCQNYNPQINPSIQKLYVMRDIKKMIIHSNQDVLVTKNTLNTEELQIFNLLKEIIKDSLIDIFPQVPLRAFFKTSKESLSHFVVGGMYVDFLLVDNNKKNPVCVVEYFGEGHYGENEYKKEQVTCNDEIKELIFQKSKIEFFVISKSDLQNNKESKAISDLQCFIKEFKERRD